MNEVPEQTAQPLADIIDDCLNWLSTTLPGIFYADAVKTSDLPKTYTDWLAHPETANSFQSHLLEQIQRSADTMISALKEALQVTPPKPETFNQFMQAFEDFMSRLNVIENQTLLSEKGVDPQTGFKTSAILMAELKKELDRRSRRGNPFAIALIKIDGDADDEKKEYQLNSISSAFKKCMRSFDDIYRIGDKEFLAGLKHSDLKGGIRFTERVRDELKILNADFTFTSCVAEPDPLDDLPTFLNNMKKDLAQIAAGGQGQTLRFEELSPLQRYVNTIKDK